MWALAPLQSRTAGAHTQCPPRPPLPRRVRPPSPPDAGGTRPGLHGQTLVSMGLVDLDRLMAGGMPLGSVTLLLEVGAAGGGPPGGSRGLRI